MAPISIGPRFVAALAIATAACSASTPETPSEQAKTTKQVVVAPASYDTFIGSSKMLQIDQATTAITGPDANLFTGNDPADGTASYNKPCALGASVCASKTWIDWENLPPANHQLVDLDGTDGKDASAFPRADACVGPANVVSKMDLGYVGVASNNEYVYLDVMRRSNLGDAGYVWIFTKKAPPFETDTSCHPGEKLLKFDISVGDVLVFGHYKTGGGPLLRVFKAQSAGMYDAVGAINFDNATLWQEDTTAVAAVAVNTTKTEPGTWGTGGAIKLVGGDFDTELFAEAAVTTSTFTGSSSACGQSFYAAVITRSSGSGGTSPDVKDVAGPAKFNFGSVQATAAATPTCTGTIDLAATVTTDGTTPVTGATCKWYDVVGATETEISTSCSPTITLGTTALPYGSHTFRVKVVDPDGCAATSADVTAAAWPAPTATADLTAQCNSTFDYTGSASGVQGTASYAWTFTHGSPPTTDGTSTTLSGSLAATAGTTYTGKLVVTDTRSNGKGGQLVCNSLPATDTALPYAPVTLSLSASANPLACSATEPSTPIGDAVTFTATAGGGDGSYVYSWLIDGAPAACSTATCTIDPAATATCARHTIAVSVDDGASICAGQSAGPKVYKKVTTVTVE